MSKKEAGATGGKRRDNANVVEVSSHTSDY